MLLLLAATLTRASRSLGDDAKAKKDAIVEVTGELRHEISTLVGS